MMDTFIQKMADLKKWPRPALSAFKLPPLSFSMGKYRHVLIFMILTVFAFQGVGILYKILGINMMAPQGARLFKEEPAAIKPLPKEPVDGYKAILDRNLLGSTDKALGEKSSQAQAAAPLASLLELCGTVAGETKYGFAVMLEKGNNKQVLVKIGNQIAGATLLKVMRDHAVLKYMGKEESLKRVGSIEAPLLQGKGGAGSLIKPASGPGLSAGVKTIARHDINEHLKDFGQMLSQAQIRPYFSEGVPDGYMINQIRQGSFFQKMGLVDGDIIQGLDNRKFQNADDMMGLFNTLRTAPGMSLTIKRAGRMEKIEYIFN